MDNTSSHDQATSQTEKNISTLLHEISQPLMVINTYVSACHFLFAKNPLDIEKLSLIMEKINYHLDLANQGIHEIRNFIDGSFFITRESSLLNRNDAAQ